MHGFNDHDVVGTAQQFTIWRQGDLVAMEVHGLVDDKVSDAWRAALGAEFRRQGHPRFYAMDVSLSQPRYSVPAHFRTAAFVRETLKHVEHAVVRVPRAGTAALVAESVLTVVGMGNIRLVSDVLEFQGMVDLMRLGHALTSARGR
ncbi:MAG: hypothetical protein AB2A00_43390 [Myxococcota bacterium]